MFDGTLSPGCRSALPPWPSLLVERVLENPSQVPQESLDEVCDFGVFLVSCCLPGPARFRESFPGVSEVHILSVALLASELGCLGYFRSRVATFEHPWVVLVSRKSE